ncbi:unnamed protein product [Larinioides sclopetarius]|uniref:Uncharacterized protein n=1 Tax=Larinioides sclopetarius TaxID=280406 RepID=A0AAV2BKZ7_9ARAC
MCNFSKTLWSTCCFEICSSHWGHFNCWAFHSRYLH